MAQPTVAISACVSLAVPTPSLPGATVLGLSAIPVFNYSNTAPASYNYNHPTIVANNADFCNITVTYTHTGQGDKINVETWLPFKAWNGRLQAVGGGGWVAGRFPLSYFAMTGAIAEGYVTTGTDAGLLDTNNQAAYTPDGWALKSEGQVNRINLQNLAYASLGDQAIISKELTQNFYGKKPDYSSWSGCSQGGRQGLMLAQKYPTAYNGIAAAAPAIYWTQFFPASIWAQVVMKSINQFPPSCELDYLTKSFVASCDSVDGVTDGLVADESLCRFDPFAFVGKEISCVETGTTRRISLAAVLIANATWTGPRTVTGGFLWHGPGRSAQITGNAANGTSQTADQGYAQTVCQSGTCLGVPVGLGGKWLQYFVVKSRNWSWTQLTPMSFTRLSRQSVQEYDSIIGTANPDLSAFKAAGGKLITYHGLSDGLIPYQDTVEYYNQVLGKDARARDFYRFFSVPGLGHCSGGNGGQPTSTWNALLAWVENGTAPASLPISFTDSYGVLRNRILCPYPQKPIAKSGYFPNSTEAAAFQCS